MDASPRLMAPTQKEEFKGDKGLASPQTRNSGSVNIVQHDYEPIIGLPAPLPAGETILWQGAPDWKSLARRAMRIRVLAVYFVLLFIWNVSGGVSAGTPPAQIALSATWLAVLGAGAIGLLTVFA